MAIVGAGTLGRLPSVNKCRSHPALSKRWGIDAVSVSIAEDGKVFENPVLPTTKFNDLSFVFYRHPLLLITDTIELWKKEYDIKQKYGTSNEYDDFHPCFLQADELYESALRSIGNE